MTWCTAWIISCMNGTQTSHKASKEIAGVAAPLRSACALPATRLSASSSDGVGSGGQRIIGDGDGVGCAHGSFCNMAGVKMGSDGETMARPGRSLADAAAPLRHPRRGAPLGDAVGVARLRRNSGLEP
mmetsp:Transcript_25427/g.72461  ORF Transcript_25427/g.72461 Transcript_25427/m.72461 type:complete len:128 (+) Transcript_25427:234-617(+)